MMFCKFYLRIIYSIFFIAGTTQLVNCTARHISCSVNPGLNSTAENINIIHVSTVGPHDTIHYLWSSFKLPSVIVARTTIDTELHLDVEKLKTFEEDAIQFSIKPLTYVGVTISELYQLSYLKDDESVKNPNSTYSVGLEQFNWSDISSDTFSCSNTSASLKLKSSGVSEIFSNNGTLKIQFAVSGSERPSSSPPHLIFSGNSTQVRLRLDNLFSNNSRVRYALGMTWFSPLADKCKDEKCQVIPTKSISDEFSPGIFTDIDLLPPCSKEEDEQNVYLTWRPVAYTSPEPSVANSSDAKISSNCTQGSITEVKSIAGLYFKNKVNISTNVFNLTFGSPGDRFYPIDKYTAWSFMIGTGVPAHTPLSLTAIIIMSVGVGALGLFMLTGAVFLTVQWCLRRKDLELSERLVN